MKSLLGGHQSIWAQRDFGPDKLFPCFEAFLNFFFPKKNMMKCTIAEIKPSLSTFDQLKWVSFSNFFHFFHVCGHFLLNSGPNKNLALQF